MGVKRIGMTSTTSPYGNGNGGRKTVSKLSQKYNDMLLELRNRRKLLLFIAAFGIPRIIWIALIVLVFTFASGGTHGFLAGLIYWCRMVVVAGMAFEALWHGYSLWRDGKASAF